MSIEDVVDRWQMMGIEPSEGEIERILSEVHGRQDFIVYFTVVFFEQSLSMDTSGQVSISDLTALLEGALTGEGKSHQGGMQKDAVQHAGILLYIYIYHLFSSQTGCN